jgi:hypothetical protein
LHKAIGDALALSHREHLEVLDQQSRSLHNQDMNAVAHLAGLQVQFDHAVKALQ